MIFAAARLLCFHGLKVLPRTSNRILRMSFGSSEPCPPPPCPCPPAKPELPPSAPEPPPCQKLPPPCPPPLCAKIPDPANPCNYCPPTCVDPNYPDLTRLKRNQCKFQSTPSDNQCTIDRRLLYTYKRACCIISISGLNYLFMCPLAPAKFCEKNDERKASWTSWR